MKSLLIEMVQPLGQPWCLCIEMINAQTLTSATLCGLRLTLYWSDTPSITIMLIKEEAYILRTQKTMMLMQISKGEVLHRQSLSLVLKT